MATETNLNELVKGMKEDVDKYFPSFYEATKRSIYLNVYSFVNNHETAEDIMQETFIRFLEKISSIDDKGSPLGPLYTISRNLSMDYLKKRSREISLEGSFPEPDNLVVAPEEKKDNGDYFVWIRSFLSEKEYKIILLHIVDDLPHREIASILKVPIGTITWSYNNALKKIRKEEEKHERKAKQIRSS